MPAVLSLQFNQFAHDRFPHNLTFVRNLLALYRLKPYANPVAREALMRRYWVEDTDLRNQFFEYLSRSGKLETELSGLRATIAAGKPDWDAEANNNPPPTPSIPEAQP